MTKRWFTWTFSGLCFFVSPGTFSALKGIDIQTGPSEYQWPLLMQFNFSHLRCCPVSQNKNCVFVCSDSNHVIILPEYKATSAAFSCLLTVLNLWHIWDFNGHFTKELKEANISCIFILSHPPKKGIIAAMDVSSFSELLRCEKQNIVKTIILSKTHHWKSRVFSSCTCFQGLIKTEIKSMDTNARLQS